MDAEEVLAVIEQLRRFFGDNPAAQGDIRTVCERWLPAQVFGPSEAVVKRALAMMATSGEITCHEMTGRDWYVATPAQAGMR